MADRVLIVEDNECNMILMRDLLTYHGFEAVTATNGHDGLRLARELRPDLLLLDLQLPVIDGMSVGRQLKADPDTAGIRIMAVTSFAMKQDRERCMEAGFDAYVTKPFDTRALPDMVRRVLAARNGNNESKDDSSDPHENGR